MFGLYASLHIYVKAHMIGPGMARKKNRRIALAAIFRALADETRLRLVNLVADREICVCYFVQILGLNQPKISRHLAYLRRAGIVAARRQGRWMHYRIVLPRDHAAASVLQATLAHLKEQPVMKADLAKLTFACCEPEGFALPSRAPQPSLVQIEAR